MAENIFDVKRLKDTKGRILSVDFGDTRTGLAVSDPSRFLVHQCDEVFGASCSSVRKDDRSIVCGVYEHTVEHLLVRYNLRRLKRKP